MMRTFQMESLLSPGIKLLADPLIEKILFGKKKVCGKDRGLKLFMVELFMAFFSRM